MAGWDAYFGTPAPDPPSSPVLCRLYGKLTDISGQPLRYRNLTFRSYVGPRSASVSEKSYFGSKITAITKRDGTFCVDLPKCARIQVFIPEYMRAPMYMEVPDLDVAPLADHLFPYPVELQWYEVVDATDPDCPDIQPLDRNPPDYEIRPAGDLELVMVAIYSNSQLYIVREPDYSADGFDAVVDIPNNIVRVTGSSSGTGTLTATLEENLPGEQTLWERVGYSNEGAPYFLSADSYTLNQPEPLVIEFQ